MFINKKNNVKNYRIDNSKLMKLLLVLNYVLFYSLPFSSCTILTNDRNGLAAPATNEYRRKQQLILPVAVVDDDGSNEEWNFDEDQYKYDEEFDDEHSPQRERYAGYRESYITEDAAKKLRHKMRNPNTQKDYDELLPDIMLEPLDKTNQNQDGHVDGEGGDGDGSVYDKKYFDYLPAEENPMDDDEKQAKEPQHQDPVEFEVEEFVNYGDGVYDQEWLHNPGGYGEITPDDDDNDEDEDNENDEVQPEVERQSHRQRQKRDITIAEGDKQKKNDNVLTKLNGNDGGKKTSKRHAEWNIPGQQHYRIPPGTYIIPGEPQPILPVLKPVFYTPNTAYHHQTGIDLNANDNHPWQHNRFYGNPNLNRYYLPVTLHPTGYYVPQSPFTILIPTIYHNAADPPHNPTRPAIPFKPNNPPDCKQPATYLPPRRPEVVTQGPTTTGNGVDIENRFGEEDGTTKAPHQLTDDDQPIWGVVDLPRPQFPPQSNVINRNPVLTTTPASRPRRPPPPLIHVTDYDEVNAQTNVQGLNNQVLTTAAPPLTQKRPAPPLIHVTDYDELGAPRRNPQTNIQGLNKQGTTIITSPTARRPPPPLIHGDGGNDLVQNGRFPPRRPPPANAVGNDRRDDADRTPVWNNGVGQSQSAQPAIFQRPNIIPQSQRPPQRQPLFQQRPTFTTAAPVVDDTIAPSQCVWAIVNCCSRSNNAIRYACFERLGCHGAFWDLNPCNNDVLDAALSEADNYFD